MGHGVGLYCPSSPHLNEIFTSGRARFPLNVQLTFWVYLSFSARSSPLVTSPPVMVRMSLTSSTSSCLVGCGISVHRAGQLGMGLIVPWVCCRACEMLTWLRIIGWFSLGPSSLYCMPVILMIFANFSIFFRASMVTCFICFGLGRVLLTWRARNTSQWLGLGSALAYN